VYLWIIQLLCSYFEPTTSAVKESIKITASVTGQNVNAYVVLVGNPEKKTHLKTYTSGGIVIFKCTLTRPAI
jgi:hypothetical protein